MWPAIIGISIAAYIVVLIILIIFVYIAKSKESLTNAKCPYRSHPVIVADRATKLWHQ